MHKAVWVLFAILPLVAPAQSVIEVAPQQCVFHSGDDPEWAATTIKESNWHPYSEWKSTPAEGKYWVRCHIDTTGLVAFQHPAIQVRLSTAYQLYFNGIPVGSSGNLNNGNFSNNAISSYPLPIEFSSDSTATIFLRLTRHFPVFGPNQILDSLQSALQLLIGDKPLLDAMRAQIVLERGSGSIGIAVCYGIIGVIAVMLLGLFLYDRSRYELLLLSIDCLCLMTARLNELGVAFMLNYSFALCQTVQILCTIGFTVTQLMFFFALARRRVPIILWALMAATILITSSFALNIVMGTQQPTWVGSIDYKLLRTLMLTGEMAVTTGPFFAFWPYARITRRMRALAGLCMFLGVANLAYYGSLLPFFGLAHWVRAVLEFRAFTVAAVLAAILALLFRDQRQVTEERAMLTGEIQAARSVQQYLIPMQLPETPGFTIESQYRSAREVGGDFFQVLPQTSDGSLLIVIGDVAGKGVEAGMLATLIVGAVRTAATFTSDPARILALLNERLQGRGLVTCLALRIEHNGDIALVNAGHSVMNSRRQRWLPRK